MNCPYYLPKRRCWDAVRALHIRDIATTYSYLDGWAEQRVEQPWWIDSEGVMSSRKGKSRVIPSVKRLMVSTSYDIL